MKLKEFIYGDHIYSKCSEKEKERIDHELNMIDELKKQNKVLTRRIANLEVERWSR
nr:MAG TPA: hypothetical protein [Caudoviricetes sp.]